MSELRVRGGQGISASCPGLPPPCAIESFVARYGIPGPAAAGSCCVEWAVEFQTCPVWGAITQRSSPTNLEGPHRNASIGIRGGQNGVIRVPAQRTDPFSGECSTEGIAITILIKQPHKD